MSIGEFEKRFKKCISFIDNHYGEIMWSDVIKLLDEARKELLNNPSLASWEEIAVPDAWEPWFNKWFGLKEAESR